MSWPFRARTVVLLVAVTLLAWGWIVPLARDMYGPMTGLSAWMMTSTWDTRHVLLLWLMWAVMMAAMMLPSAMPLLLLYDRSLAARGGGAGPVVLLGAGYVAAWAGFSVAATALQRVLSASLVLNPMMEMTGSTAIGLTLLIAGVYQLTPWKASCLRQCRSPLAFLMGRWQSGPGGAFRLGLVHGVYCLGCCWALMLLLFAGGVMNLTVIVGLTALVLVEKLSPFGVAASRITGGALVAAGAWWLSR